MELLTESGIYGITIENYDDSRGRTSSARIDAISQFLVKQVLTVRNSKLGTLRGLHFQDSPMEESKMIICTKGRVFDVLVNRQTLATANIEIFQIELGVDAKYQGLYIPSIFAHGYQTLTEHAELIYLLDQKYSPEKASGYRWNDPRFNILWPLPISDISERDKNWSIG